MRETDMTDIHGVYIYVRRNVCFNYGENFFCFICPLCLYTCGFMFVYKHDIFLIM